MTKLIHNGWEILFHPKFFGVQYQDLFVDLWSVVDHRVTQLKQRLPEAEYKTHTTVKLFAAITIGIETKIPADPFASHFALTGPLKHYGRIKKMGAIRSLSPILPSLRYPGAKSDRHSLARLPTKRRFQK